MEFIPHDYQLKMIELMESKPKAALFLDMGLGKTVIALTAIDSLINDQFLVRRCLIVAPKKVAEITWPNELKKWDHLSGLKMSVCIGDGNKRIGALRDKSDCTVINRENIPWLEMQKESKSFDMIVIDESTSFKNRSSLRWKSMSHLCRRAKRVYLLTGTPVPNGLLDLWPQMFLLDQGQRLGTSLTRFKDRWFVLGVTGWNRARGCQIVYSWDPKSGAEEEIASLIGDVSVSLKASDYLTMPKLTISPIEVCLSRNEMECYKSLEKSFIIQSEDESKTIRADSAGVLCGKLLQAASGECYLSDLPIGFRDSMSIHNRKVEALIQAVEDNSPKPVFIMYNYRHERDRIMEALKDYHPVDLKTKEDADSWNRGEIQVMLGQPQSIGYGLNLQAGGHIMIWFSPTWNLELWQQSIDRLYRQGQESGVVVNVIVAKDTIDEQVMEALKNKEKVQDWMLSYVKLKKGDHYAKQARA